jgi:cysteinyl-tRNA synthetase
MAVLSLHNSQTRGREVFVPSDPSHVRVYVCGPTVYDLPHLGNIRSNVAFDVIVRLLRYLYPRVTYVRNITDVDDKINARAAASGETIAAVTARTGAEFAADMAAIGNMPPDIEPLATAHIPEMIEVISRLVANGHAYAADGHVLFSVRHYDSYGALSGRSAEDLLAGARVEVATYKRDAGDFVLWKPSTSDLPGWESPWGRGRPGWHIECSAMSWRYLGESFDIHGGGSDLIFPHHENERAQSLCAFPGSSFARYWLHNGMLQVNGEKMSKSLGNFFTLRDVLARAPAEAVRLLLLRARYRAVLDFTDAGLVEAGAELDRFYRALQRHPAAAAVKVPEEFLASLCDDMNTPAAIAVLHRLATASLAGDGNAAHELRAAGALLGLLQRSPAEHFQAGAGASASGSVEIQSVQLDAHAEQGTPEQIDDLLAQRKAARVARDFGRADEIRLYLASIGVVLEDGPAGTTWRRVR